LLQELAGSKPVYRFLLTDTWPARNPPAPRGRSQYPPEYRDAGQTGQGL